MGFFNAETAETAEKMAKSSGKILILSAAFAASALSAVLYSAPVATAAERVPRGISVVGEGVVVLKPAFVMITAVAHGEAPLASDAVVKCRDIKRRATHALSAMKLAGLTVSPQGMVIDASGGFDPDEEETEQTQESSTTANEPIEIKLAGLDGMSPQQIHVTVAKLIDVCHDSGLQIDDHEAFKLASDQEAHDKAYDLAMKDAMRQAKRFAELAHAKVGPIVYAEEVDADESSDTSADTSAPMPSKLDAVAGAGPDHGDPVLHQQPVRVRLSVIFEVSR